MVADNGVKILSNIHLNKPPSVDMCAPHSTALTVSEDPDAKMACSAAP